ncbi:hypothetical protein MYSTI_08102 [Myxococcus stipitatus DSM 14675]|uniref:Outer membrane protein beta-barrel domain-containing protein n=1 Tax=Myxococcus stipitatus (strain DSM 14675 / JCM 12634 / Mx s8) TaxID=1278073 RepID=L7UMZ2_MYXSD|nr:hypothetical protein [Myxococcus stipitatus]AGC49368.1 hypothetical protein MYSTI_08102 [Myxococcus stipitatus DSM 14675]
MEHQRKSCVSRSLILSLALLCGVLSPGISAAEVPLMSLPTLSEHWFQVDMLIGTEEMGTGAFLPFRCTEEKDGLALEARQRYSNGAVSVEAAYRVSSIRDWRSTRDVIHELAAQLGVHVRTASRTSEDAALGPTLGLTINHWLMRKETPRWLEVFAGVQGAALMVPHRGELEVPVRASIGIQGNTPGLNYMLVMRGGWDDTRQGFDSPFTVGATLAVGFGEKW